MVRVMRRSPSKEIEGNRMDFDSDLLVKSIHKHRAEEESHAKRIVGKYNHLRDDNLSRKVSSSSDRLERVSSDSSGKSSSGFGASSGASGKFAKAAEIGYKVSRDLFILGLILLVLDIFNFFNIYFINSNIFLTIVTIMLFISLLFKSNQGLIKKNSSLSFVYLIFFLFLCIVLTLNQFYPIQILINFNYSLVSISILLLTLYLIYNNMKDYNFNLEKCEFINSKSYFLKFNFSYGINENIKHFNLFLLVFRIIISPIIFICKIPYYLAKTIHDKGWVYTLSIIFILILFISIKLSMLYMYSGSYIDEYNHIFSGIELVENYQFAPLFEDENYLRGSYVSFMLALLFFLFGTSLVVAKLLPIILGIINFFILFSIAKKVLNKYYVIVLMLIYSLSPWIIFNHYYVRVYVFYEFYTLIISLLFIYGYNAIQKNNLWKFIIVLLGIGIIDFLIYLSFDIGSYIILVYSGLGILYLYIFESHKLSINSKKKNLFFDLLNTIFSTPIRNKVYLFVIIALIFFFLLDIYDKILRLLFGTLEFTTPEDLKYNNFFFNLNIIFTILFLSSIIVLFNDYKMKLFIIVPIIIFFTHIFSSPDLQITRGVLYFLPIFYLVSLIPLSQLKFKTIISIFFIILLSVNIYSNYPEDFFVGPNIPFEINYVEYNKIFSYMNENCYDKTKFVLLNSPYISYFYNTEANYSSYIRKEYLETNRKIIKINETYYTKYKEIEVLSSNDLLVNKIYSTNYCIVMHSDYKSNWRFIDQKDFYNLINDDKNHIQNIGNHVVIHKK